MKTADFAHYLIRSNARAHGHTSLAAATTLLMGRDVITDYGVARYMAADILAVAVQENIITPVPFTKQYVPTKNA